MAAILKTLKKEVENRTPFHLLKEKILELQLAWNLSAKFTLIQRQRLLQDLKTLMDSIRLNDK